MPYTYEYPRPAVTVDAVIFRNENKSPQILLIKRLHPPFQGMWAIPGGFIEIDEELIDAAKRELHEETGIKDIELHEIGVYGKVNRDPRHRTISVIFAGIVNNNNIKAIAADDAAECNWFDIDLIPQLAFDHNTIIIDAIKLAKEMSWI